MKRHRIWIAVLFVGTATLIMADDQRTYEGKPLSHWIAAAKDGDPVVRRSAMTALANFDPKSPSLFPTLFESLHDSDYGVGMAGRKSLSRLAEEYPSFIPWLIDMLGDEDPEARHHAESALINIAPRNHKVADGLIAALSHEKEQMRVAAAEALRRHDTRDAVPALIKATRDPAPSVRVAAIEGLLGLETRSESVLAVLRTAAWDPDPRVRSAGTHALGSVGRDVPESAQLFFPWLKDDNTDARAELARLIRAQMNDESAEVRAEAGAALTLIKPDKPDADELIAALVRALKDDNTDVRLNVIRTLGGYGPDAKAAVPALIGMLTQDHRGPWYAAEWICHSLARIGVDVKDVPALIEHLKNEPPRVHWGSCGPRGYGSLLGPVLKATGADAVPLLLRALEHEHPNVRAGAAEAIGLFRPRPNSPEGKAALPTIVKLLSDPSATVRVSAALAVWRLDGEKEPARTVLHQAQADDDPNVRCAAVYALFHMGEIHGDVSTLVLKARHHKQPSE